MNISFTNILQIIFGHSKQLWGLAVHPDDELFATAGYDKNISLWKRHALLWSTQVCTEHATVVKFIIDKIIIIIIVDHQ